MPLEVQGHTVPHLKALISGKLEPRGLRCGNTFILCYTLLKRAILLHKMRFVWLVLATTALRFLGVWLRNFWDILYCIWMILMKAYRILWNSFQTPSKASIYMTFHQNRPSSSSKAFLKLDFSDKPYYFSYKSCQL